MGSHPGADIHQLHLAASMASNFSRTRSCIQTTSGEWLLPWANPQQCAGLIYATGSDLGPKPCWGPLLNWERSLATSKARKGTLNLLIGLSKQLSNPLIQHPHRSSKPHIIILMGPDFQYGRAFWNLAIFGISLYGLYLKMNKTQQKGCSSSVSASWFLPSPAH